jgi:hypothetical protein
MGGGERWRYPDINRICERDLLRVRIFELKIIYRAGNMYACEKPLNPCIFSSRDPDPLLPT